MVLARLKVGAGSPTSTALVGLGPMATKDIASTVPSSTPQTFGSRSSPCLRPPPPKRRCSFLGGASYCFFSHLPRYLQHVLGWGKRRCSRPATSPRRPPVDPPGRTPAVPRSSQARAAPCRNAWVMWESIGETGVLGMSQPMRGILPAGCAPTASGAARIARTNRIPRAAVRDLNVATQRLLPPPAVTNRRAIASSGRSWSACFQSSRNSVYRAKAVERSPRTSAARAIP